MTDPAAPWDALTAVGTFVLALVTAGTAGVAVWLPRRQARQDEKQHQVEDWRKCNIANMQMKHWTEPRPGGPPVVHAGWPASYPVKPVACGLVKNSGGAGVMDIKLESPNQAILE